MHNKSNGTLIINSEQWTRPQDLMTKAEAITRAYKNVNENWGKEKHYFIGPGWDEARYYTD